MPKYWKPLKFLKGNVEEFKWLEYIDPIYLGEGTPTSSKYLRGDGTWVEITGNTNVTYERKSDYSYPFQYSGTAPVGTLTSEQWSIKRIDYSSSGGPVTTIAIGAWDDRNTLTYT